MHYYQHNIKDYRADTAHLSLLEHGAYRQLLDWYYLDQTNIPKETEVVFRRLRAVTEEDRKAIVFVLSEFFCLTENGYKHARCDREIAAYSAKASRARDNGKSGGRPAKTKVVISGLQEETQKKANHKPRTINQEEKNDLPSEDTEHSLCGSGRTISSAQLQALGVDKQVASEFVALRKRKKSNLTPLALEGIRREAGIAGLSLNDALRTCVEKGWQGFSADWLNNRQRAGPNRDEDRKRALDELTGRSGNDHRTIDITATAVRADPMD